MTIRLSRSPRTEQSYTHSSVSYLSQQITPVFGMLQRSCPEVPVDLSRNKLLLRAALERKRGRGRSPIHARLTANALWPAASIKGRSTLLRDTTPRRSCLPLHRLLTLILTALSSDRRATSREETGADRQ